MIQQDELFHCPSCSQAEHSLNFLVEQPLFDDDGAALSDDREEEPIGDEEVTELGEHSEQDQTVSGDVRGGFQSQFRRFAEDRDEDETEQFLARIDLNILQQQPNQRQQVQEIRGVLSAERIGIEEWLNPEVPGPSTDSVQLGRWRWLEHYRLFGWLGMWLEPLQVTG